MSRRLSTLAFGASVFLSFFALFLPEAPDAGIELPGFDKAGHVLVFGLLALTSVWRFGFRGRVVLGVIAYAGASEVVQAVLFANRSGDLRDFLADVGGATAGLLLADAWTRPGSGSVESTSAHDEVPT